MLDFPMVVQSAISSFNNAAIVAPSFFWSAVLMLPLFALVYFYGNDFISRMGWTGLSNPKTRTFNFALCIEVLILAWLIIMPGNYAVLRDSVSTLPFVMAGVIFVLTASVAQKIKAINPPAPAFWGKIKWKKTFRIVSALAVVALAGFAGAPTWWGFLINAAAIACGALVGFRVSRAISPILFTSIMMFAVSAIVLMQPEFFRFGQLGNLTIMHLIFVSMAGALVAAIVALRNVNPRGRIYHSAYVKLKWLGRILAGLCMVLFVLTESVPVFFFITGVFFVMFVMSVWHATSVPENLSKKLWAALVIVFGIMIALPLVASLGLLYWINLPKSNVWGQSKFLL